MHVLGPLRQSLRVRSNQLTGRTLLLDRWYRGRLRPGRCCSSSPRVVATRGQKGTKTTTTVDLNDLPQGMVALENGEEEALPVKRLGYPTVVQQARNNMIKFAHCVVLTRVGSFYELYFEQAEEYAALLNIKLASKKTSMGRVPMAGFPFFQLERYLKVLVQGHGKHVAISEEVANDDAKSSGLMFDRKVQRIVTPGTLIDEAFLNPFENNYLLAISNNTADEVGLAWLDLSSGEFLTQSSTLASLASAVARIRPREIIVQRSSSPEILKLSETLGSEAGSVIVVENQVADHWESMFDDATPKTPLEEFPQEEMVAANLLMNFVAEQLPGLKVRLQAPLRQPASEYMGIDKNSLRGLEVTQTMKDGHFKGSLMHAVRRTSTESGARLLLQRITSPSLSITTVNERLDLVETFLHDEPLQEQITSLLRRTSDTLRLVQKFSFGRGDADDLVSLAKTVNVTRQVGDLLVSEESNALLNLTERFVWSGPSDLAGRIFAAIDQEGLELKHRSEDADTAAAVSVAREVLEDVDVESEGLEQLQKRAGNKRYDKVPSSEDEKDDEGDIWIMRRDASLKLTALHENLQEKYDAKSELRRRLREMLAASSLTLKFTPGQGHVCHVKGRDTKAALSSILPDARTVGSSRSTRLFVYPEWTALGNSIENVKIRIRSEEQALLTSLRDFVIRNLVPLRRNAAVLDELDVSCSFARLAIEHNLSRPILNNSTTINITSGRHITVEAGLTSSGRNFTPNDCYLSEKQDRIYLITGPNMAGKSTFLRQTALISILAQTGSFVPASYAEIGLIDHIFSRVGSADNLAQDQSTFMVEMLETAQILRCATPRSFVIMDEVGRGTTPEDGVAVGFSVLSHLQNVNKCRTLFATHFHSLADMTKDFEGVSCHCNDVVEESGGSFRYDHRMRKGVNRESHALKVAKMAGMPNEAIEVARGVLQELQVSKAR